MSATEQHRLKLLIVGFCPPDGVISELMCELAGALNKKADVDLLCPENLPLPEGSYRNRFAVNYSKSKPLSVFTPRSLRMLKQVRSEDYDIAFFYTQHILNAPISLLINKPKQVMWWHEPVRTSRQTKLNNLVYFCSDMVLTRRTGMILIGCQKMITTIPVKLRGKLKVVPLPFIDAFDAPEMDLPVENSPADLVFFGRIFAHKGLDVLANSLEILRERGLKPLKLLVIGKGNLEENCPRLLALSKRFPDQIEFRNRYERHGAISAAIAASKALVLPYLSGTATATVQTAYRQSKPVVVTEVGCLSEYVVHSETGLIVPPDDAAALADAIQKICSNDTDAARMGSNGYKMLMERFSLDKVSEKILNLFDALCGRMPVETTPL